MVKCLEDGLGRCIVGESVKLSFEHWVDALEGCCEDDEMAVLGHLVAPGLGSEYANEGLDARPDGAYCVTQTDKVEVRSTKVTPHSLEGDIIVTIAIVNHSPEG